MRKAKLYVGIACVLILLVLCGCNSETQAWQGYGGTMDGYEFFYSDDRNRAWEEDILCLAETYLTQHPVLSGEDYLTITYHGSYESEELSRTNVLYDPAQRQAFIEQVNLLIPRIGELSDTEILFEIQRIVASLSDCHSSVRIPLEEFFPILLETMADEDGCSYYARIVPDDWEELLYGKLVSINGTSVDEIVTRLSTYISHEYEAFVHQRMSQGKYLTRKDALQIIGVLGPADDTAEFTFETACGMVTCDLNTVTKDEFERMECVDGSMRRRNIPMYRYADEKVYWYEVLEDNTLYIRVTSMSEDPNQSWNVFYSEIGNTLKHAEKPMKLVIDLRYNSGGSHYVLKNLIPQIQKNDTNGVYILINGGTASASVLASRLFADSIPGLLLVGTPAAQPANMLALNQRTPDKMPNSGYEFQVSRKYAIAAPDCDEQSLFPDITVYQTIDDYKIGKDTVLEYILAIK